MADKKIPADGTPYGFEAADWTAALTALSAIDGGGSGTAAIDTTHSLSGTKSALFTCAATQTKLFYQAAATLNGDNSEFNVEMAIYIDPSTQPYEWAPLSIAAHDAANAQLIRRLALYPAATGANHCWRIKIVDSSFSELAKDAYAVSDPSVGIASGRWYRIRWRVTGQQAQGGALVNTIHRVYVNGNEIVMKNAANEVGTGLGDCVIQQAGYVDQCWTGIRSNDGTKTYKCWIDDWRIWQAGSFQDRLMVMSPLANIRPHRGIEVAAGSNVPATLTLSYGETSSLGSSVEMTAEGGRYMHRATLPDGALYYQVTAVADRDATETARSEVRSIRQPAASPVVIAHSDLQDMIARAAGAYYIKARTPDLLIAGGDITDNATRINGVNTYNEVGHLHHFWQNADLLSHASAGCPVCAVTGNHDADRYSPDTLGDEMVRGFLGQIDNALDGLAYSFELDGVHYACLHNDAADDDRTAAWIEADLKAAKTRWKGLVLHCNLFGSENSGNVRRPAVWNSNWQAAADAVIAAQADFCLSCHQHTFNVEVRGGVVWIINSCPSSNLKPDGSADWGTYNNAGPFGKGSRPTNLVKPGYTVMQFDDNLLSVELRNSWTDVSEYKNIFRRRRR